MNIRGEAAAIEQQHDLAAAIEGLDHGPFQAGTQAMQAVCP